MTIRILILISILGLFGCSSDQVKTRQGAASGYEYRLYKDVEGPKSKIGDQVYFNMDIYNDKDSLLQSYRQQDPIPSVKILDINDPNRKQNAIVDVLTDLTVGDSVGVIVPRDSVPGLPPGFEDVEYIEYRLVVEEIISVEEVQNRMTELRAKQQAEMDAFQEERKEVEAIALKTIKDYKDQKLDLIETPGGVKYIIHELGTGKKPVAGMMASVMYYGALVSNGEHFDDAYQRGRPYSFRLGSPGVIEGWQEAAINFPEGTKASVFIPAKLGYGDQGSPPRIPPGAELYFYMNLTKLLY